MDKQMIDDVGDLIDITIHDMLLITKYYKAETINIYFGFLEEQIMIELPVAEIMLYKNSVKGFFKYLREKITEKIKETPNE